MCESSELQLFLMKMQRFLLDSVRPQLRAVKVDIDEDEHVLFFWFYFDGEISYGEEGEINFTVELVSDSMINKLGSLYTAKKYILRWDYPKKIPESGYYAYLRDETIFPNHPSSLEPSSFEFYYNSEFFILENLPLLSQYALLGNVRPNLRAVKTGASLNCGMIYLWFYFDGVISDEDRKIAEIIGNKVISSLGPEFHLELNIDRLDAPEPIPSIGDYAYERGESPFRDERTDEDDDVSFWHDCTAHKNEKYDNSTLSEAKWFYDICQFLLIRIGLNYRAISFALDPFRRKIYLWFYLDGEIHKEDIDEIKSHCSELCSKRDNYVIEDHIARLDFPSKIPLIGRYIFLRDELPLTEQLLSSISPYHLVTIQEHIFASLLGQKFQKSEFIKWLHAEVSHLWQQAASNTSQSDNQSLELSLGASLRAVKIYANEVEKELNLLFFFHKVLDEDSEKVEEIVQKVKNKISSEYSVRILFTVYEFPKKNPSVGEVIYLREGEENATQKMLSLPLQALFEALSKICPQAPIGNCD